MGCKWKTSFYFFCDGNCLITGCKADEGNHTQKDQEEQSQDTADDGGSYNDSDLLQVTPK